MNAAYKESRPSIINFFFISHPAIQLFQLGTDQRIILDQILQLVGKFWYLNRELHGDKHKENDGSDEQRRGWQYRTREIGEIHQQVVLQNQNEDDGACGKP